MGSIKPPIYPADDRYRLPAFFNAGKVTPLHTHLMCITNNLRGLSFFAEFTIFFNFSLLDLKDDNEKLEHILEMKELEKIPDIKGLPKKFKQIINRSRDLDRLVRPLAAGENRETITAVISQEYGQNFHQNVNFLPNF